MAEQLPATRKLDTVKTAWKTRQGHVAKFVQRVSTATQPTDVYPVRAHPYGTITQNPATNIPTQVNTLVDANSVTLERVAIDVILVSMANLGKEGDSVHPANAIFMEVFLMNVMKSQGNAIANLE